MIDHDRKLIFIHIPKCAGSSIETYFGARPFDWQTADYDKLTGWCPKRGIHLQHATAGQLLDLGLVDPGIWGEYFKLSVVRNPWDRALSGFLWMKKFTAKDGSFEDYLNGSGEFGEWLDSPTSDRFRGEHILPQSDFLKIRGNVAVDYVARFETLRRDMKQVCRRLGMQWRPLPHEKRGAHPYSHYSRFYTDEYKKLVEQFYGKDIATFNYSFEARPALRDMPAVLRRRMATWRTSL